MYQYINIYFYSFMYQKLFIFFFVRKQSFGFGFASVSKHVNASYNDEQLFLIPNQ